MATYDFNFASWSEFVRHANYDIAEEEKLGYCKTKRRGRGDEVEMSFHHVMSFEECLTLAGGGWKEGVKQSKALSSQIERRLVSKIERQDMSYDLTGEVLDIGRYCAGEPEHWGVWNQTIVDGPGMKLIHIVLNGSASAAVSREVLIGRGATIAALVSLMELAGYRAKVTLCFGCQGGSSSSTIKVSLKDHDQSLDEDKLAFALAHPASLRCLAFSVWDTAKNEKVQDFLRCGYGQPKDLPKDEQGDVYLGMMHSNDSTWASVDRAEKWVLKTLQNLGVLAPEREAA